MKKLTAVCTAAIAAVTIFCPAFRLRAGAENKSYKAAYLCDAESGIAVYQENETKRLPIASMCKVMTLLLSFEAVESGTLSYDEMITVSENAAGMGGSQVYLDKGLSYRAEELMKTVAVCSANDSCVALSERIAGSEEAFVAAMNARAKQLGAENTLFANCTGLPKEPQYSCAKDVAIMLRELIKHKKYYEFSKIWMENFAHPDGRTTQITNTNKLIRSYDACDGGKTGFTNEAGFCLAATAKRGETRLVSVVIGSDSSKNRFSAVKNLFETAFQTHESKYLLRAGENAGTVSVAGGKEKQLELIAKDSLSSFGKKGEDGKFEVVYDYPERIKAPIQAGDEIGYATLYYNGVEVARTALLAKTRVCRMNWWDAVREGAHNWN